MIELRDLSVGYGGRVLLEGASCSLQGGRLVALLGRNGAGKSSLLRVLAGAQRPLAGRVVLGGVDLESKTAAERAKAVALVTTERVRVPDLRCRDLVGLGRAPYTGWMGRLAPDDQRIVAEALEAVDMSAYADRTMDTMSDGECQRVMIARAIAQDTPCVLLDEPTSFLDLPNRYELCLLLRNLARSRGKCIVFSTHELDIALRLCDDILLLDPPHLLYGTPAAMLETGHIARLFNSRNMAFDESCLSFRPLQ